MSLTEMSRPVSEARIRYSGLSYMIDAHSPGNPCENTSGISQNISPPLQIRPPGEPVYYNYLNEPKLALHTANIGQQSPKIAFSHHPMSSHCSSNFSALSHRPSEPKHSEIDSPLPGPIIKQDDSEDLSDFSKSLATLSSPSCQQSSPVGTIQRISEVTNQAMLHHLSTGSDISRQMEISSVISSDEPSSSASYEIIIRQQPIAARACGFGDKDRRAIDPPPILQMLVEDPNASPAELDAKMRHASSVIYCELWNAELDHDETTMREVGDRSPQRRLMGTLVASPFIGRDENDVEGCFFPFPDLSCRTPGKYRLRFALMILYPARLKTGDKLPFKATILSDVFEVYPAKAFPGMVPSTALAKRLKEQGCLISVKKGHQKLETSTERSPKKEED